MHQFKILTNYTRNFSMGHLTHAIISGSTIEDYVEQPLKIKAILNKAITEWLDLLENKNRKEKLDSHIDINDLEGMLDRSMVEILAKHGLYDLDIYILPCTTEWNHDDNLMDR